MSAPIINRLRKWAHLSDGDVRGLSALGSRILNYRGNERAKPSAGRPLVCFIVHGMALYSVLSAGGRRQVVDILLPGDVVNLPEAAGGPLIEIQPADQVGLQLVDRKALSALRWSFPRLSEALDLEALDREQRLIRRMASVGQLDAMARVADLLFDVYDRSCSSGHDPSQPMFFGLTQTDIGDATGITPVHTNRVLQRMRRDNLIRIGARLLTLLDPAALCAMCGFFGPARVDDPDVNVEVVESAGSALQGEAPDPNRFDEAHDD